MVSVTRLNGSKLTLNALLIESIEPTPDTLITLTTGKKYIVMESVPTVVELIQEYMKQIGSVKVAIQHNAPEGSQS